jgi:hypothetical protein
MQQNDTTESDNEMFMMTVDRLDKFALCALKSKMNEAKELMSSGDFKVTPKFLADFELTKIEHKEAKNKFEQYAGYVMHMMLMNAVKLTPRSLMHFVMHIISTIDEDREGANDFMLDLFDLFFLDADKVANHLYKHFEHMEDFIVPLDAQKEFKAKFMEFQGILTSDKVFKAVQKLSLSVNPEGVARVKAAYLKNTT